MKTDESMFGKKPLLFGSGFVGEFDKARNAKAAKTFPVTWQQAMGGKKPKEKEDDD